MSTTETETYHANGHEFELEETYRSGAKRYECAECLEIGVVQEDEDAEEYLDLISNECRFEWLREPEGSFHGVALRNGSCFRGRELLSIKENGEIADNVRIYDDDAPLLSSLLSDRWSGL